MTKFSPFKTYIVYGGYMKNVSKQDKINFYKQITSAEFQHKIQAIEDKYYKIGSYSIKIFLALIIIGCFITPWIAFAGIPAFTIPIVTIHLSNKKIKQEVEGINSLFSYEDLINMKTSGEWALIAKEIYSPKVSTEQNNNSKIFSNNKTAEFKTKDIEYNNTSNHEI